MKNTLLLTLSAAALLAFAIPAMATEDSGAPTSVPATAEGAPTDPEATAQQRENDVETVDEPVEDATEPAPTTPENAAIGRAQNAPAEEAAHEGTDAHAAPELPAVDWSFDGPLGTFDRAAMQRGFQVYKQVCAACHGLNRLSYRNLAALGYDEGEIKAFAAEATVTDGPNDEGEMFERPGRPADRFKSPFANEEAARYANNGALPPDLSLIVRARHDGANYVHAILTGYTDAPAGFTVNPGMQYNKYFAGHQIAMPAPLVEGALTYDDGTPATVEQMASDVTTFLAWASEPVMEVRKQTGVKVMIFLLVFSVLMYLTKRKIWKDMH